MGWVLPSVVLVIPASTHYICLASHLINSTHGRYTPTFVHVYCYSMPLATHVSVEKYMHVMCMPVYEFTLGRLRDDPSAHTYVGLPCTTPSIAVDMFYTTKHCRYMIRSRNMDGIRLIQPALYILADTACSSYTLLPTLFHRVQ